jgi:hypothetical protein
VTRELSQQLSNWRRYLPEPISWDDDAVDKETIKPSSFASGVGSVPPRREMAEMIDFRPVLDASLRTRYKHAQYLIWRPYIYRALHTTQDLTSYEYECCKNAFKVS